MTTCLPGGLGNHRIAFAFLAVAFGIFPRGLTLAGEPIAAAIERGAIFIQRQQRPDGCWQRRGHQLGETALAGLALLAAGHSADAPSLVTAAGAVRRLAPSNMQTYDVALAVMFLDRLGKHEDSEVLRQLGDRLRKGQAANGCWTYSLAGSPEEGDNSNAQFAILACWICRRHGVAMNDTILKTDRYFRSTVNRMDGGWGYTPISYSTATMSCAGLVALAAERGMSIERSRTKSGDAKDLLPTSIDAPRDLAPHQNDPVAAAALQYLAAQLRRDQLQLQSKPGAGLYFYWSLERVGVIYGLTDIGGVDWYEWGVARLLPIQRQNGSWGRDDCVDTAFAVLFLSKQNLAEDLTDAIGRKQEGGELPPHRTTNENLKVEKRTVRVEDGATRE